MQVQHVLVVFVFSCCIFRVQSTDLSVVFEHYVYQFKNVNTDHPGKAQSILSSKLHFPTGLAYIKSSQNDGQEEEALFLSDEYDGAGVVYGIRLTGTREKTAKIILKQSSEIRHHLTYDISSHVLYYSTSHGLQATHLPHNLTALWDTSWSAPEPIRVNEPIEGSDTMEVEDPVPGEGGAEHYISTDAVRGVTIDPCNRLLYWSSSSNTSSSDIYRRELSNINAGAAATTALLLQRADVYYQALHYDAYSRSIIAAYTNTSNHSAPSSCSFVAISTTTKPHFFQQDSFSVGYSHENTSRNNNAKGDSATETESKAKFGASLDGRIGREKNDRTSQNMVGGTHSANKTNISQRNRSKIDRAVTSTRSADNLYKERSQIMSDDVHVTTIVDSIPNCYPYALTTDEDYIYYSDWLTNHVMRLNKKDSRDLEKIVSSPVRETHAGSHHGAYGLVVTSHGDNYGCDDDAGSAVQNVGDDDADKNNIDSGVTTSTADSVYDEYGEGFSSEDSIEASTVISEDRSVEVRSEKSEDSSEETEREIYSANEYVDDVIGSTTIGSESRVDLPFTQEEREVQPLTLAPQARPAGDAEGATNSPSKNGEYNDISPANSDQSNRINSKRWNNSSRILSEQNRRVDHDVFQDSDPGESSVEGAHAVMAPYNWFSGLSHDSLVLLIIGLIAACILLLLTSSIMCAKLLGRRLCLCCCPSYYDVTSPGGGGSNYSYQCRGNHSNKNFISASNNYSDNTRNVCNGTSDIQQNVESVSNSCSNRSNSYDLYSNDSEDDDKKHLSRDEAAECYKKAGYQGNSNCNTSDIIIDLSNEDMVYQANNSRSDTFDSGSLQDDARNILGKPKRWNRTPKKFGPKKGGIKNLISKSFSSGNKAGALAAGQGLIRTEDGVVINIEDCCQMTLCDTPCYTTIQKQGKNYYSSTSGDDSERLLHTDF